MKELTYATVCSGIECMSAACADLPMKPVFFSEIEPFPCAVLKSHFPDVPNLGDMSKFEVTNEGREITNGAVRIVLERNLDIFAGGTPCQDVSVAGKRSGMQEGSGTRSSLAFEFVRLVRELRPRYVLWENVAGVLSDKSFPDFLTALANCGYGVAYRTLDAQWVRVADCYHEDGGVVRMERAIPQRRRRVWVVGCAGGDVAKASQILFEHSCIVGNTPPRRRTGQEIARAFAERNRVHGEMVGDAPRDRECLNQPTCVVYDKQAIGKYGHGEVSSTVKRRDSKEATDFVVHHYENHGQDSRVREIAVAPTIPQKAGTGGNNLPLVVFNKVSHPHGKNGEGERWDNGDVAPTQNVFDISETRTQVCVVHTTNSNGGDVMPTLDGKGQSASGPGAQEDKRGGCVITRIEIDHTPAVETGLTLRKSPGGENGVVQISQMRYIVRRTTPTECERLMGFPDGWTIPRNLEVTDALVAEFQRVHDTYGAIMYEYAMASYERSHREGEPPPNPPKPKSAAWVRKWIEKIANPDTCPDAPRYKACGNGWATNQPRWILLRLLSLEEVEW